MGNGMIRIEEIIGKETEDSAQGADGKEISKTE